MFLYSDVTFFYNNVQNNIMILVGNVQVSFEIAYTLTTDQICAPYTPGYKQSETMHIFK